MKNLPVGAGCEAFLTTSKARVIAHVAIAHRENNVLWLDFAAGQAETVFKHLNHFLISERAEIADRSAEFGMLRIIGPRASERFASIAGSALDALAPWQTLAIPGVGTIRRQRLLALDGFDVFTPIAEVAALKQRLLEVGVTAISNQSLLFTYQPACLNSASTSTNRLAMEVIGRKRSRIRRAAISVRKPS